jgi:quercetin dioxygenase-like cupin family protein
MFKPVRVEKPWGHELIWAHTDKYVGKILHVKKGEKLSLQYHDFKDETIHLLSGSLRFEIEEDGAMAVHVMAPGASYHIRPHMKHRMEAAEDCDILEASTPQLDDVVRLQDAYGRAPAAK